MNNQKYELPVNVYNDWDGHALRGFQPTPRQQLVIAAMQSALSAGLFFTCDVVPHCAAQLKPSAEQLAEGVGRVENGIFGMDCYYARKYLDAVRCFKLEDESKEQLNPYIGQKLGTLMFNDFKRNTGMMVQKILENGELELVGKRGRFVVTLTCSALNVRNAIERAVERSLRKDNFSAFVGQMTKPQEETEVPVKMELSF